MDQFFAPSSLAVYGLSSKAQNTPRIIVENCLRWGFRGRIFGINPTSTETDVSGIRVYRSASELPVVPGLAALLVPARFVPQAVEDCGRAGIKRLAIQSGGFNESSEQGTCLADQVRALAQTHGIRFVGPNSLTLADTTSGLCLPFVPSHPLRPGGFSLITQSGGLGLFLWNLLENEQVGMAKFASIGNKLDLDEVDFLKYFGQDPATQVIGIYLESITQGKRLIEAAQAIDKPIIIFKANTTAAGNQAAMSHTAALSNDEAIIGTAFERAGILRINHLHDFITTTKAFMLPPMRGKRIMAMSPAGGLGVAMADLCERQGFAFADPGEDFYRELREIANAGIIRLSNPLDMGDIYQIDKYPLIFSHVLASPQVDGAVFVSQWPRMPTGGKDVFTSMFTTDLTLELTGAVRSSAKPLALALYGDGPTLAALKERCKIPVFNGIEEAILALHRQMHFHSHRAKGRFQPDSPTPILNNEAPDNWLSRHTGIIGEESLEFLNLCGLNSPQAAVAHSAQHAADLAETIGFPVALKVMSPQAVHKTEAGGVLLGINNREQVEAGFAQIQTNLAQYAPGARLDGVRVVAMAGEGHDLFIGGLQDPSFGPVVFFGYGGILLEVLSDVERVLCPSSQEEIREKLQRLQAWRLLSGIRGQAAVAPDPFIETVCNLSQLLVEFPAIEEIDINPVRVGFDGRVLALDARMRLKHPQGGKV
ncbi:MAG: acetate--CoA ligase family protein [Desulfobulbus sp.]|nr:acetate--CoA ligase family protein [Desulfobulbus sp.]